MTRIENNIRATRRATRIVLILDALLILVLVGFIWLTCVSFLDTSLADGLQRIAAWMEGTR
jgi:hypothetical protein